MSRRRQSRVIPYTVNEPADWERLIAWGVDGITTDVPDRLLECLLRPDGDAFLFTPPCPLKVQLVHRLLRIEAEYELRPSFSTKFRLGDFPQLKGVQ